MINPSMNCDDRPYGTVIDSIIIHYTGMLTAEDALQRLCDDSDAARYRGRVSAHYMIDETGKIYALVDERDRAWHAGVSYWRGKKNLNDNSIGIELVNPGHEFGYQMFPRAQMDALIELCQSICKRHPIKQDWILGHSDIAPNRKSDPGEKFNWRLMARNGIGLWPEAEPDDYPRAQMYLSSDSVLKGALVKWGYDPECELQDMCRAFNRHFGKTDSTILTWEVGATLSILNRKFLKS
ncbi:MAG: N-acetylmuramoyl-L-alanine amidase [Alphaproteobacteria bacterium]|nr:N-acetylmuramoyl-L-alanine amidase [Alphaproteobacteria bacterium]